MYFSLFTGLYIKMHKITHYHLSQHCPEPSSCPSFSSDSAHCTPMCDCERWVHAQGWAGLLSRTELPPHGMGLGQPTFGLWVGHASFTLSGCKDDLLNNTQYWILSKSNLDYICFCVAELH